jgi:putative ATP-binding cassette transporter
MPPSTPRDPGFSLDRRYFKRVAALCAPYWRRPGAWRSWAVFLATLALVPVFSLFGAWQSTLFKDQTNALVAKQAGLFWHYLALLTIAGAVRSLAYSGQSYAQSLLHLDWRRWLTAHMVGGYLSDRAYFEIESEREIDNPDQRIQQEVSPFCSTMTSIPQYFLGSITDMGVQAVILWYICRPLFWAVVLFAVVKSLVILRVYKPTIKQHYDITVAEADLRHGLLHVRDNAETVAFYRGEHAESRHVGARLDVAIAKARISLVYQAVIGLAYTGLYTVWDLVPVLFLAPLFFSGKIQYGIIAQGTMAASMMLNSMQVLANYLPMLANLAPGVIRLSEMQEKFERAAARGRSRRRTALISLGKGPHVSLEGVSLETPGGELRLVRDLDLTVANGEHLIILGRTGVGKSSLLRAVAGLWTRGRGRITTPPAAQLLFLPQRPYMILADLREQLMYPSKRSALSDGALQLVLEAVGLPELAETHGGFDARKDWARILSLGEQQRVAFARFLIARPRYVFLDEATSAVDLETERRLYALLERSGTTFISVGHRPSIHRYHRNALRLRDDGAWKVGPVAAALRSSRIPA